MSSLPGADVARMEQPMEEWRAAPAVRKAAGADDGGASAVPAMPPMGYWSCVMAEDRVRLDARSAALLDFSQPGPASVSVREWEGLLLFDQPGSEQSPSGKTWSAFVGRIARGRVRETRAFCRIKNGGYRQLRLNASLVACEEGDLHVVGSLSAMAGPADGLQAGKEAGASPAFFADNGEVADGPLPLTHHLLYMLNAAGDGLWDWNITNGAVYYSPSYLAMLGYTAEEFSGLDMWMDHIHPADRDKIILPQQRCIESSRYGDSFECTFRMRRKDGSYIWIFSRGYVTCRDKSGRATRIVGLHTDITSVQSEREKLEELVRNDILTGLRSRVFCEREMQRLDQHNIRPVSIIVADLDGLKLINDYLGHTEGDRLLVRAAGFLQRALRATDCVARMGGDEFVLLLPSCPEKPARDIMAGLRTRLEAENASGEQAPVYVSLGCACADGPDDLLEQALLAADHAMLDDKAAHRAVSHQSVKAWIERVRGVTVSLRDSRVE